MTVAARYPGCAANLLPCCAACAVQYIDNSGLLHMKLSKQLAAAGIPPPEPTKVAFFGQIPHPLEFNQQHAAAEGVETIMELIAVSQLASIRVRQEVLGATTAGLQELVMYGLKAGSARLWGTRGCVERSFGRRGRRPHPASASAAVGSSASQRNAEACTWRPAQAVQASAGAWRGHQVARGEHWLTPRGAQVARGEHWVSFWERLVVPKAMHHRNGPHTTRQVTLPHVAHAVHASVPSTPAMAPPAPPRPV
eukprot:248183-Chlamydomonas_euryale.AAC.8